MALYKPPYDYTNGVAGGSPKRKRKTFPPGSFPNPDQAGPAAPGAGKPRKPLGRNAGGTRRTARGR